MKITDLPREFVRWLRAAAMGPELRRGILIHTAAVLADLPDVQVVRVPAQAPYPVFNPGMVATEAGFLLMARSSSYVNFREADYRYLSRPHHTTALLLHLDDEGRLMRQETVDDGELRQAGVNGGIEDVRLFRHEGRVMGIGAAVSHRPDGTWRVGQAMFELDGARIVRPVLVPQVEGAHPEKNWVPLVKDGQLWLAYSVKPAIFMRYGPAGFELPPAQERAGLPFDLRGGTPFIPWGKGHLALVHTSPQWWGDRMHYLHHFVYVDEALRLAEVSPPFFLVRRGTEFACGLVHRDGELWVSLGLADRHCAVVRLPARVVDRMVLERS